ncbi:E3 ubiquitin-protein ligase RNFT1-like [Exaiptasia diaphana]|uniref:RING-type domain-containing protein n=1 Tax=Exaiptasia diaphana TaxID=2652724 RepID=A0A913WV79_EXADI|nr:E3 ubiquitin-protein ligase RNFT1-like [Exaiptasia diaphana]
MAKKAINVIEYERIYKLVILTVEFIQKIFHPNDGTADGKYYMLLEHLSQLYRMLVPMPLWFAYFTDYNYGGEYFALVATSIYLILKGRMVFAKVKEVYSGYQTFCRDVQYGTVPSKQEINEVGNSCPICQEDLTDPIMLRTCKHIFCEDCISLWFDREQTCPMCRAKVVEDPTWRDGSTSAYVQIF